MGKIFLNGKEMSIEELRKMGSKAIDLVVVNLYPFETILKGGASRKDIINNIDSTW